MKQAITATQNEKILRDDEFIVSKTDTKGRLTYFNRVFIDFAGYSQQFLMGKQHNIVRHPDMPRGVFHLLWETLQAGYEFNGYVKNICADGSFYWVFANVTPSYSSTGKLLGYYSVRRKPRVEKLNIVKDLYRDMLQAEKQAGAKDAIAASSVVLNTLLNNQCVSYDEFILKN